MKRKIIVTRKVGRPSFPEYHACLEDNRDIFAVGISRAEAVGNLVFEHQELLADLEIENRGAYPS